MPDDLGGGPTGGWIPDYAVSEPRRARTQS
jgi:hypothetical protein